MTSATVSTVSEFGDSDVMSFENDLILSKLIENNVALFCSYKKLHAFKLIFRLADLHYLFVKDFLNVLISLYQKICCLRKVYFKRT